MEKNFLKDVKTIFLIVTLIVLLILAVISVNKSLSKVINSYGESKGVELSNAIINQSIYKKLEDLDEKYILVERDKNGKISSFSYNNKALTKTINEINDLINENIIKIQNGKIEELGVQKEISSFKIKKGGIYYQIPLFAGSKMGIFASLGPKVPLKFQFLGTTNTNIISNITSYGFNNVIVELILNIDVYMQTLIPFNKKNSKTNYSLIISSLAVQGEIPAYFFGSNNASDMLGSIPIC